MNHQEAVLLARYVQACCPQQTMDDFTYDAWHDLLGDLDAEECKQAAANVAKRQPFVAPAEIRAEVKRIREARIPDRSQLPAPPPELADDPKAWADALRRITTRLGSGEMPLKVLPRGYGSEPSEKFKESRSQEDRDRVTAQTVACPSERCPALPGEPCRPSPTAPPLKRWHPNRLRLARGEELLPEVNEVPSLEDLERGVS